MGGVQGHVWLGPGSVSSAATTTADPGLKPGPFPTRCSAGSRSTWSPQAALPLEAREGRGFQAPPAPQQDPSPQERYAVCVVVRASTQKWPLVCDARITDTAQ